MKKTTAAAAALTALLGLTACAEGGEGGGNEKPQPDPVSAIEDLPSVSKSVELTESTDPNDMLGRPNGYTSKIAVTDSRIDLPDGFRSDAIKAGGSRGTAHGHGCQRRY